MRDSLFAIVSSSRCTTLNSSFVIWRCRRWESCVLLNRWLAYLAHFHKKHSIMLPIRVLLVFSISKLKQYHQLSVNAFSTRCPIPSLLSSMFDYQSQVLIFLIVLICVSWRSSNFLSQIFRLRNYLRYEIIVLCFFVTTKVLTIIRN